MGNRYLITGVQLGMLKYGDKEIVNKIAQEIEDDQYIGDSSADIISDCERISKHDAK